MTVFDRMLPYLVGGVCLLAVALPLAVLYVGKRVSAAVRALWAIETQLQHARRELAKPAPAGPLPVQPEKDVPAPRVAGSMFGR